MLTDVNQSISLNDDLFSETLTLEDEYQPISFNPRALYSFMKIYNSRN